MFGLFGSSWLEEQREKQDARVISSKTPSVWSPTMKWEPYLYLKSDTYNPKVVFDVTPHAGTTPIGVKNAHSLVDSGHGLIQGDWLYMNRVFPKGKLLDTFYASKRGKVMFDGDVLIPVLFYKDTTSPFMSLTPMEVFTLRGGTRLAKGHVVVGGLGMGYQLREVLNRKQVQHVTLVEKDPDLVDWILPRVTTETDRQRLTVIVDDAYKVIPKLTADVALIDIYHGYNGNTFTRCPSIGRVWVWGSSEVRG